MFNVLDFKIQPLFELNVRHEDISHVLLPTIKCNIITVQPVDNLAWLHIYAVLWPHPGWQVFLTGNSNIPKETFAE